MTDLLNLRNFLITLSVFTIPLGQEVILSNNSVRTLVISQKTTPLRNRWVQERTPSDEDLEDDIAAGDIPQYAIRKYTNRKHQNQQEKFQYEDKEIEDIDSQRYQGNILESGNERQNHYKNRKQFKPMIVDQNRRKCRIWVPAEAVSKYEGAIQIQIDQAHQLHFIEVCCQGFRTTQWRGKTICRPICENCANGFCQAPDECICYDEFVRNDNGDCVFACPLGCQNGKCYLDGSCQCDPGYKLDEMRKFCRPICSNGCGTNPRHNCTEPEVCSCAKGYKLTDEGCQPTCQPDCGLGGICIEFNKCECQNGFNFKDGVCQADCYQKCDNGMCYSRNRCICNSGYIYHEHSTQCIPM